MGKIYIVRVNCTGFHDYAVRATSKKEAASEAEKHFQCDGTDGSADEFLDIGDTYYASEEELKQEVNANFGLVEL